MEATQATPPTRTRNPAVLGDSHLTAYNAAFSELGLRFRWNMETITWLTGLDCDTEEARIAMYIETYQPHLLTAYDAEFLSHLIYNTKSRHYSGHHELAAA